MEELERGRRHGPRPLPPEVKRSIQVSTWVNADELESLSVLCRATGMRRGELLRKAALAYDIEAGPPRIPEVNARLYGELAKAQANLNQIARHLNIAAKSGRKPDAALVGMAIGEVRRFRDALIGVGREGEGD